MFKRRCAQSCQDSDLVLGVSRVLAQGARERDEKITSDEFMGLLKVARTVVTHEPTVRELPAHMR
jgi:hypothetical protein